MVKRYDQTGYEVPPMDEWKDGQYVLHSDYLALKSRCNELEEVVREFCAECEEEGWNGTLISKAKRMLEEKEVE